MLQRFANYFNGVSSVFIDGTLYVLIAVFGALQSMFTTEEAYKYVAPYVLFWGKAIVGVLLAAVSAIKIFRSTSFARHVGEKREVEEEDKADAKEIKAEIRQEAKEERAEGRDQRAEVRGQGSELHGAGEGTAAKPVGD